MSIAATNEWIMSEFGLAKFKDLRLNKRFITIMVNLFNSSTKGNKQVQKEAHSKGLYRFLKNKRVELNEIFESHVQSTIDRLPQNDFILNIQDTSGLNYHEHDSKIDIGHIGSSSNRPDSFGYWLHTGLLCDSKGGPLGLSYQEIWSRLEWNSEDKNTKKSRNRRLPIEDKESYRWLEGVDICRSFREASTSRIVHVCDREADIYELFQKCQNAGDAFLIRAKSNRIIRAGEETFNIKNFTQSEKVALKKEIFIEGNSERIAKLIRISARYRSGTLIPPISNRTAKNAEKLSEIPVTIVHVTSKQKINGKPVNWKLITNLEIADEKFLEKIIEWYALRWRIEIFFKALKSGAQVESLRLIDIERLSKYILMLSIKAFRILQLAFYSRVHPDCSIREILTEHEWKVSKKILFSGKGRPTEKAGKVIELIAQQGGYLKGKGRRPGIITLWEGWTRLSIIISGAKALGFS